MKTNPKSDVMPPPPYLCATYHWEPSGLLAKSQAHLPSLSPTEGRGSLILISCCSTPNLISTRTFCHHADMMLSYTMLSSMLTTTTFLWHPSLLTDSCIYFFSPYPLLNILSSGFPPQSFWKLFPLRLPGATTKSNGQFWVLPPFP